MPLDQPEQIERALRDADGESGGEAVEPRMSFGEHLEELRYRVILALCGPVVTTLIALFFGRDLVAWLVRPLAQVLRSTGLPPQTYNFTVAGGFAIYIKVSVVAGLILAAPWIVYQFWKFIQSGLYQHERRVVLILLPFSTAMAALGVAFHYYVLLPISLMFLVAFSTGYPPPPVDAPPMNPVMQRLMDTVARAGGARAVDAPPTLSEAPAPDVRESVLGQVPVLSEDPPEPRAGEAWIKLPERELRVYFDGRVQRFAPTAGQSLVQPFVEVRWYINFVVLTALGLVIAFQLPVVMLVLGRTGLIDPAAVASARKYCVLGCAGLSAVLTPSDPISMLVLALPLWGLFEAGLLLMRWTDRRRAAADELES